MKIESGKFSAVVKKAKSKTKSKTKRKSKGKGFQGKPRGSKAEKRAIARRARKK